MPFENPPGQSGSDASFGESETLYHSIYAAMDEGMALHEIIYDNAGRSTDYRIVDVNPAFERITGITRNTALNALASELYGTGNPPYLDIYARVAQSGVTESFETHFAPMTRSFSIKVLSTAKGRFATIFEDITERKKSQQELLNTARQRQLALDAANMGWWSYDPVTRFSTWDNRFKVIFDITENQLPSDEILNRIIHPEDLHGLCARVKAALDLIDPQPFDTQYRINHPDGNTRWIEAHGIVSFEGEGELRRATSFVGTVADITTHKQSEEALVQSLERLKLAQVSAGVGVWDWNMVTGKLEWSEELFHLLGLDSGSTEATFDSWKNVMHPDDRLAAGKRIEESIQNHTQLTNEYRIVHSSGELRWINAIGNTTYDTCGNPLRMAGICIDITPRKLFEELLQESREDLCHAQTVARIGSWRLDVTRNELAWSDENHRIFGLPKETPLTYETFLSVVHPDDREYVDGQWKSALAGKHYDIEHRLIVDGSVKWVRETAGLEFDASGKLLGGFGTTQDITDRKRDEEELRKYREELEKLVDERTSELRKSQEMLLHAQKMEAMGQLAGGIAHDFNNMMQVVIGFAHRTLRKLHFENPLRENLEQIGLAAKSASILTHRLLAFSRRQMLQPEVLSPNDLVTKIKPILRHTLGEDIEFFCDLQPGLGNVKVDPTHLEQVIMNMAVNARNAMPSGGKLSIQTADTILGEDHPYDKDPVAPGRYIMLAISDTGFGMDNNTLEKIFEPFFTTRPFGSGSGLGLATAYGTIRQSAGAIRVYSEVGRGTTFKIYLPRSEELPSVAAPPHEELKTWGRNKTVLVVEDNDMAREFVVVELRDLGYQVLAAGSGEDACTVSRSHNGPIHLLLTDVVLPGASGRKISGTLSAERPEMATLYMSGYDKELVIEQGRLATDARLLVKPFSPEQLANGVREALLDGIARTTDAPGNGTLSGNDPAKPVPSRILVVDDDPGIAEIISEILREPGDAVEAAENGATALQIAATLKPEVVLLDIKLPDMDGHELAKRIREMSTDVKPYIIAASGYAPEHDADNSVFDDYLIKPIDFTRLKELVVNRASRGGA